MIVFIFWFSIFFVLYTYLMYPVILYMLVRFQQKITTTNSHNSVNLKTISIIISAKNEEGTIESRITNLSQQNYDISLVELIIVSDGSVDNTETIILEAISNLDLKIEIKLISLEDSYGKPNALNAAVNIAKGEILIFTDCRQEFDQDALKNLTSYFSDPSIGAVSGELVFRESKDSSIQLQVGMYWAYEKFIRKMESKIGSTIGVTGAIYAMRKSLYSPINKSTLIDDVVIPIGILVKNYKVIFSDLAIAYDYVSKDEKHEWKRKVRTLAGNWQLLDNNICELFKLKLLHLCMVFSHKLFRVFVPFFLVIIYFFSLFLEGMIYNFIFGLQSVLYLSVVSSYFIPQLKRYKIINLMYFFVMLNVAAVVGFYLWMTGNLNFIWKKSSAEL